MKKIATLFVLLLCASLYAQQLDNALLWKITGNGLKAPSYLFGTNHILCNPSFSKAVTDAITSSSAVVFESGELSENDILPYASRIIMTDTTLSSLCTADEFARITKKTESVMGFTAEMTDMIKPWVLLLGLVATSDCEVSGSETALKKIANAKGLPIATLENVDVLNDFFNLMEKVPVTKQIVMLLDELDRIDSERNNSVQNEDINSTADTLYNDNSEFGKELAQVLLVKRNNAWLPIIETKIVVSSHFIAVGSAHLGGEHGIILLLRSKGFTVEAVE